MRLEYRKLCEQKRKEETDRWEKEAEQVKKENEVWKIVHRGRKRRIGINKEIEEEDWKAHFMRLLGGVDNRITEGEGGKRRDNEEEISKEEIKEAINRIKKGKAIGIDGIPGEAWMYAGEETTEWVWSYCNRVWKGEAGWPEEWKEGVIVPIVKKRGGKKVEDYRGVTIMTALYKIYTVVLAERIKKECEEKGIIPHNQTGFRQGMGTIDNIYVLNYL
ncbi:PREDICTED: uncharacterized protein LOC105558726, partial [Vollenhovia emeryi]|uniref:uncharacterized protein LOC105558726 n=1 Tax=Vollenhovia emeryi TaxID=411798 RepID=UPI0005F3AC53